MSEDLTYNAALQEVTRLANIFKGITRLHEGLQTAANRLL